MAGSKPPLPHTYLPCHDSCFPIVDACELLQYQGPYSTLPVFFCIGVRCKRFAFGSEAGFRKACCLTTGRVGNLMYFLVLIRVYQLIWLVHLSGIAQQIVSSIPF